MKGEEHRYQFTPRKPADVPSFPEGGQGEKSPSRLFRGEHGQYLFARVRMDIGEFQALAAVPD
jgi:hypothetical protein